VNTSTDTIKTYDDKKSYELCDDVLLETLHSNAHRAVDECLF